MELNNFSTLQRRPGYLQFNSHAVSGIPQNFYSFQPAGVGTVLPLVDTTTAVQQLNPAGGAPTSLITKSNPVQSTFKSVGTYCYVGNPAFAAQKIDAALNVTNMGIAIGASANTIGPTSCTSGADVGPGANPWTNPTGIASDILGSGAELSTSSMFFVDYVVANTFGFSIPLTEQITGIQVTITGVQSAAPGRFLCGLSADGSTFIGNTKGNNQLPLSNGPVVLGGPSDLWGLTAAQALTTLNGSTFGVMFGGASNSGPVILEIILVQVTVFGIGGPTATPTGSGSFAAQNGFTYAYAYGNSASGNISNLTPVSANTGPFSAKDHVAIGVDASTDAQVNQIRVFRTTDGGPQNLFFELPNSPFANSTGTVQDKATDPQLQQTSIMTTPGLNFPPATGMSGFEWYAGRLWGFVNNILYFSSGPDIIQGNGPECWNPDYSFALPLQIVKLVSLGAAGMLVFTLDTIHIVQGSSTQGFTVNVWAPGVGVRTFNAVDYDGTNVWAFTSDRQLLQITPSGITEPGDNIGDQLDLLDPTLVYVRAHRSGSQDQNLFISNGSTTLHSFNLKLQAWNLPQTTVGGLNAIDSIEIMPGVYKFLLGSPNAGNTILQRDLATFSDNGSNYACSVTFGNIQFADPGMLAVLESLVTELSAVSSVPSVSVLVNDISGNFAPLSNARTEPATVSIPTPQSSYKSLLWYLSTGDKNKVPRNLRHLQFQLSWPSEAVKEEILGIGLLGPADTGGAAAPQPQIQGR